MTVKVGDKIIYEPWSGPRKTATIEGIQICRQGEKYGREVGSCDISKYYGVLDLDNGHWCYFYQVKQVIRQAK